MKDRKQYAVAPRRYGWAFLLIAAMVLVLLTGCGDDEELSLDSQGNLSYAQWGITLSEAQEQLAEAVQQENTLELEESFLDAPVTLTLQFSQVSWADEPILYGAQAVFSQDTDIQQVSDALDQIFGAAETTGVTQNGETYDLQEADYYWHGPQTVSELTDEAALLESLKESNPDLDTDYMAYVLETSYPVKITLSEDDRTLSLDAKYYVDCGLAETAG